MQSCSTLQPKEPVGQSYAFARGPRHSFHPQCQSGGRCYCCLVWVHAHKMRPCIMHTAIVLTAPPLARPCRTEALSGGIVPGQHAASTAKSGCWVGRCERVCTGKPSAVPKANSRCKQQHLLCICQGGVGIIEEGLERVWVLQKGEILHQAAHGRKGHHPPPWSSLKPATHAAFVCRMHSTYKAQCPCLWGPTSKKASTTYPRLEVELDEGCRIRVPSQRLGH